jgi:hypothetical protein
MNHREKLERELQPMKGLLERAVSEADAGIVELERELRELRDARRRAQTLLRQLDPELRRNGQPRPKQGISEEAYRAFLSWLTLHRTEINQGPGFYAGGLHADPSFSAIGDKSRIARACARAHEEGIITLVSRGKGGRKNFKVV